MFTKDMTIKGFDDELWTAIQNEARRQEDHIELIASENYASPRVLDAPGSQANAAVYMALLNPGDHILGMSLAHGGHLTHGAKVNFSGKIYNAVQYGLNEKTGEIDYAQVARRAKQP